MNRAAASADRPRIGLQESEALKAEVLEQMSQFEVLAERLIRPYESEFPPPDTNPLDIQLRAAVSAAPKCAQELVFFAREALDSYHVVPGEDEEKSRRVRHDLSNKLTPVYGTSQEVVMVAPPDTVLASRASELREACETVMKLIDLLTGKIEGSPKALVERRQELAEKRADPVDSATILVVDDNKVSARQLERHLTRQQHTVLLAHNGQQAIEMLQRNRDVDLVLLDVIMPVMDGFKVLACLKEDSNLRDIPVIMVSGFADDRIAVDCIGAGAEDYLSKPVNQVLLDARVGSCLRRRQAEKHRLRQYFSQDLARELSCDSGSLLRTRDANVSILFGDIRRFSAISERVGGETTIELIGSIMGALSRVVFDQQGVLIDYIGDGLMAMWGAPKTLDNHADLAVQAGLSMVDTIQGMNAEWAERLDESVLIGIGINSGPAHVGVIGSSPKFKYGPMGPTVNLASRVEGTTKHLHSSLVVTYQTRRQLQDRKPFSIRRLCKARVVNMQRPVGLYEIRRFDERLKPLFKSYEQALRHFERREFRDSSRLLARLLADYEDLNDVPCQLLMSRVLAAMSAGASFNPVWEFPK